MGLYSVETSGSWVDHGLELHHLRVGKLGHLPTNFHYEWLKFWARHINFHHFWPSLHSGWASFFGQEHRAMCVIGKCWGDMSKATVASAPRLERRKTQWEVPRLERVISEKTQGFLDGFVSRDLSKVLIRIGWGAANRHEYLSGLFICLPCTHTM